MKIWSESKSTIERKGRKEQQRKRQQKTSTAKASWCVKRICVVCLQKTEKSKKNFLVVERQSDKGTKLFLEANQIAGQLVHQVHAGHSACLLLR